MKWQWASKVYLVYLYAIESTAQSLLFIYQIYELSILSVIFVREF